MADLTPRLGIKKPLGTENVTRAAFNENYDIIDAAAAKKTDVDTHVAASTGVHGATSAATVSTIIQRDASGRAKVAAPAAADDIARKDTVDAHATRTDNPHSVTTTQIGAIPTTQKGAINGVATLDSSGTIPDTQIPAAITRDSELSAHTSRTDNPHGVTAAQVGAVDLSSFTNSKAASGYQRLAGGVVIQWGTFTSPATVGSTSITFPIAFPTLCTFTTLNPVASTTIYTPVNSMSTTGFTCVMSNGLQSTNFTWFAIGY